MKIIYPQLDVTIIDSLNKQINFTQTVGRGAPSWTVHFYHGRAEGLAPGLRPFELNLTWSLPCGLSHASPAERPFPYLVAEIAGTQGFQCSGELDPKQKCLNLLFSKVKTTSAMPYQTAIPLSTVVERRKKHNKYPRKAGMQTKDHYKKKSKQFRNCQLLNASLKSVEKSDV